MSIQDIQQKIHKLKQKPYLDDEEKNYLKTLQQRLDVKNLLNDLFNRK